MRHVGITGPVVLIVLGFLFLLGNLGWDIPVGYLVRRLWPLIFVGVGLAQIAGSMVGRGNLASGLLSLTFGVLFLLQQVWSIRLSDTWPVLLIVAGAIGLLRNLAPSALFGPRFMRGVRR